MGIDITKANPFIARLFKDNEIAKKKYPKKVVISINSGGKFMVVSSGSGSGKYSKYHFDVKDHQFSSFEFDDLESAFSHAKTLNLAFSKSSNESRLPKFVGIDY